MILNRNVRWLPNWSANPTRIDKQHRWSKWAAHGNFDHDKALIGDDLIATRHYHDFDPKTGEEYQLQDRLLRTDERSFVLMVAGEKPGDPEIAKPLSLDGRV
jgi:hypothetical protein